MPGNIVAAIAADRARISSILESDAGKARPSMAVKLALHTAMDAQTAMELLASSQPEKPYFAAAMEREGGSGVNASGVFSANASNNDPRSARLEELKGSMSHYNSTVGYTAKAQNGG